VIAGGLAFQFSRATLIGVAAVLAVFAPGVEAADSVYTSIRRSDCSAPPPDLEEEFSRKGLGAQECPAPEGWRLLFVASDANSWIELRHDDVAWSAERALVYERPIGLFPNVGGSSLVEWRRDMQGNSHGLIFRVVAQDPVNPMKEVTRLFVVRLDQNGPCLIGRATTNDAARVLADSATAC
jgi:hypothetical protein